MNQSSRGALAGLTAAVLFRVSTPLTKHLVGQVRPQLLAGLLYVGAALALTGAMATRRGSAEAPLRRADAPSLALVTLTGGVIAPVLLLVGLERVTGIAGSLMLNLEGVFTVLLALALFGEHLDRRAGVGVLVVLVSAAILGLSSGTTRSDWIGLACIGLACAAWAIDNNVTQRLSSHDRSRSFAPRRPWPGPSTSASPWLWGADGPPPASWSRRWLWAARPMA